MGGAGGLERRFRDSRERAQGENVGLARLPDRTRLVRIGDAVPLEVATWRYGAALRERERRRRMRAAAGAALPFLVAAQVGGLVLGMAAFSVRNAFRILRDEIERTEPVLLRVRAPGAEDAEVFPIRTAHLPFARITAAEEGALRMHVPDVRVPRAFSFGVRRPTGTTWVLGDADSRTVLRAGLPRLNSQGCGARTVRDAVDLAAQCGGLAGLTAHMDFVASLPAGIVPYRPVENAAFRLALEMALHEEEERRVLEGEIFLWEAAWREAEEVARIADALPGRNPGQPAA